MTREQIWQNALALAQAHADDPYTLAADAQIIALVLDESDIIIPEEAVFFGSFSGAGIAYRLMQHRLQPLESSFYTEETRAGSEARAYTGEPDFGHTAPGWDDLMRLGLAGMQERVRQLATDEAFIAAQMTVWEAARRFCRRAAQAALEAGKPQMAAGLAHLADHAPATLYEAMQLVLLYYGLQQHAEGTPVRSLGRLDRLFDPFLKNEDPDRARTLVATFTREIDAIRATANIPFMLGGSDAAGNDLTNPMSYLLLEEHIIQRPAHTKLHLLCTPATPRDFLRKAFAGVKAGANSMVFINDGKVIESLQRLNQPFEDAVDYAVVGCYECGGKEEVASTTNARVNIPKALELALHNGCDGLTGQRLGLEAPADYPDFEALYNGFRMQLGYLVLKAMAITNGYERAYPRLHASPLFTATYPSCLPKNGDIYNHYAPKYHNSSLNAIGLATAADALAAIRKLVYEDHTLTLNELVAILDSNWANHLPLRERIRQKFPKYGNGDPATDALAAAIVKDLSNLVNNVPNVKGGVYRLGTFSIDWRLDFGKHTAASADGRCAGDPLSQNTSASFGADREGAAGHLLSVTAIDAADTANGSVVDLDLHASQVQGEKGVDVLLATLDMYLKSGGFAIHYNVLDTATLRDAQLHPENYPNLQVRLCGWNVKFNELSRQAQDEFIRRGEHQGG